MKPVGSDVKTDNDFTRDKCELRAAHLPAGDVRVLDCFSGKGVIWRGVERLTGRRIQTLPIDVRADLTTFHLDGNNQEFLETMDLSKFNVIDLDAYGSPHEQLAILFRRGYVGVVFVTFIQTAYGMMAKTVLRGVGFSDAQLGKSPTLFGRRGWEYFKQWLALNGVTSIAHRSHGRAHSSHGKHYLCFTLKRSRAETRAPADPPATPAARRRRGRAVSDADLDAIRLVS